MGFFSKVFKGIGKVFRKVGRGLKKLVGKVGKIFGKFGIVGQIGLGLVMPYIFGPLGSFLGKGVQALQGMSNPLAKAAGTFIEKAVFVGTNVGKAFSTVTEGVTKVIGETVGAVANNLGLSDPILNVTKSLGINAGQGIDISNKTFGSVWDTTQGAMENAINAGKDIFAPMPSPEPIGVMTPEFQKNRILEAEKTGVELPEWDKVLDISEVATDKTLGYTPSPTAQPSLLSKLGTAVKEIPGKVIEQGSEAVTKSLVSAGMQTLGLEQKPEYTTQYYAASVPTIDMSGTTDIGQQPFDAVSYVANNMESINMNPWGYNANMYNAATYQNRMRQFGFA